jgi:serine phosphatase RsbU (regulator of sigma subunit)
VLDLKRILADAAKNDPDAEKALQETRRFLEQLRIQAGPAAQVGLDAAAIGLRMGAAELSRLAREKAAEQAQKKRMMKLEGGWVNMPIERDGAVVAKVSAQLNLKQILTTVMSASRRDQGEIAFAIDADRKIFTPKPGDLAKLKGLNLAATSGLVQTEEPWIIVKKTDASGVTFGIARPIGASLAVMRRAAASNLGLGLAVIFVALVGIVPMSSHMTRDLSSLTDGVRAIARGDLAARVPVRSRDEFGELAKAFNQMTQDLAAHQKLVVDQERLHKELELCRRIQNEMLPHEPLRLGLTEVKGVSIPAREVGGDFFNYFLLPDGQIALLVGDVSGKGVSAALLMANIQATLRARLPLEHDLTALIDAIDRDVDANTPGFVFLTLFVGVLDTDRKTMRYVNAGHNPQYLLRGSGELEPMSCTGLPVGMFSGHGYKERAITLSDGDLLFFYTDGMVEVEDERGELFGAERLEALLARAHEEGLDDLLARIELAVKAFRGAAEPFDDATMMALRLGGVVRRA